MITIKNLIKNYGKGEVITHVLRGVDLEVKSGEFLAIMGRSGAGKSTLLYQMSLLDVPSGGNIIIDGVDTAEFDEKERTEFRLKRLGYIFQDYALLPELTAEENVMAPILMLGKTTEDARKAAHEALEIVGLSERHGNRPSQLSGGEQQRVSIARAIAQKPDILFADEPTANLDSLSAEPVIKVISDLHKAGQTTVMVTHEPEYARVADRIVHLEDGKIVSEDRNI